VVVQPTTYCSVVSPIGGQRAIVAFDSLTPLVAVSQP
jgi:hypothetical protein